jgi:pimeloyl-ACP methyl ester carboxylesterase
VTALLFGLYGFIYGVPVYVGHIVKLGFSATEMPGIALIGAGVVLIATAVYLLSGLISGWRLRVAITVPVCIVSIYLLFPILLGVYVTQIPRVPLDSETPADHGLAYRDVSFRNDDGDLLSGWYVPSRNGASVIIVHGSGGNRTGGLDHAAFLAREGYGVLLFEVRGFGESEGEPVGTGWTGAADVAAATTFLEGQPDVEPGRIGGMGISMGGEVLIQAAAQDPRLAAVVSDGAGIRFANEEAELPGYGKWSGVPMYFLNNLTVQVISGERRPPPLHRPVDDVAPRPLLLVSAPGEEATWNRILLNRAGPGTELWETGVGHTQGLKNYPEQYQAKVLQLFAEGLLGQ